MAEETILTEKDALSLCPSVLTWITECSVTFRRPQTLKAEALRYFVTSLTYNYVHNNQSLNGTPVSIKQQKE